MTEISKIKNFLSGNFKDAILSCKIVNGELSLNLKFYESKSNNKGIENYSDIETDTKALFNHLIDNYLNSGNVIRTSYESANESKTCCVIEKEDKTLSLCFEGDIEEMYPDFVKKIEITKQKGIISFFDKIKGDCLKLRVRQSYTNWIYKACQSGLEFYENTGLVDFSILRNDCEGKIRYAKGEIELTKILIKEFLKSNSLCDEVFLDTWLNLIKDKLYDNQVGYISISFNNKTFIASSMDELILLRNCILEMKELKPKEKQLVLKGFR